MVQLSGREDEIYLKQVQCQSEDHTTRPISLEVGQTLDGCSLVLSREVSVVDGQILKDSKPADGLVVVLIPQERERRKNPRNTMTTQSGAAGRFAIAGVVPGDYFVFAVPPTDDQIYFDLEFAEKTLNKAERLRVEKKEVRTVHLKLEK